MFMAKSESPQGKFDFATPDPRERPKGGKGWLVMFAAKSKKVHRANLTLPPLVS